MFKEASKGHQFVLTEYGYQVSLEREDNPYRERILKEREPGKPIKGFETQVPRLWVARGYVVEREC